ncbi:MAG: hypothetical protein L0G03_00390, partial [Lactococcus lactis]|nr:hypothetical protein [Lactococcus lactis]
ETKKLDEPMKERVSANEFLERRYGFQPVFSSDDKEIFLNKLIFDELLPKSFPKNKGVIKND